jgi:hypothetical protein
LNNVNKNINISVLIYTIMNDIIFKKKSIKFTKCKIEKLFFYFNNLSVSDKLDKISDNFIRLKTKISSLFYYSPETYSGDGIKYINFSNKTAKCKKCIPPDGICTFRANLTKKHKITMYNLLKNYTEDINTKNTGCYENGSRIFYWEDTIKNMLDKLPLKIQKNLTYLINDLFSNLQFKIINKKKYCNTITITLIRYKSETGLYTHVDNIRRAGAGPIISYSYGPDHTIYDLMPLDKKTGNSLRLHVSNKDYIVIGGDTRWMWAHSLPYNYPYKTDNYKIDYRFAILFRFPVIKSKKKYYNFWRETVDYINLCDDFTILS